MHWHEGQCLWRLIPNYAVVFTDADYADEIAILPKVNWFKLFLFNSNNSIQRNLLISIQSNGSSYCYVITILQFLNTIKGFQITQFLPNGDRVDTAVWMHCMDAKETDGEKAWRQLHKNAVSNIEQVLDPQSSSYTATYHPSRKLSKLDEPDMPDTTGEVRTSS